MNDLLQLKKPPTTKSINEKIETSSVCVSQSSRTELKHQQSSQSESTLKNKEKCNTNNKRPSLTQDVVSPKRAKGQETIKATPQLMQQLMSTNGSNKLKLQTESTSDVSRWSSFSSPQKNQQQQPASNSVLMNLLVSGCDVSAGYYTCLPRPKVAKA